MFGLDVFPAIVGIKTFTDSLNTVRLINYD